MGFLNQGGTENPEPATLEERTRVTRRSGLPRTEGFPGMQDFQC